MIPRIPGISASSHNEYRGASRGRRRGHVRTVTRICRVATALAGAALVAAGCGSSSTPHPSSSTGSAPGQTSTTAASTQRTAFRAPHDLSAAERPVLADFPAAGGRSLTRLAGLARTRVSLGPTTGTFTPGTRRFAFALTTTAGGWVYAP